MVQAKQAMPFVDATQIKRSENSVSNNKGQKQNGDFSQALNKEMSNEKPVLKENDASPAENASAVQQKDTAQENTEEISVVTDAMSLVAMQAVPQVNVAYDTEQEVAPVTEVMQATVDENTAQRDLAGQIKVSDDGKLMTAVDDSIKAADVKPEAEKGNVLDMDDFRRSLRGIEETVNSKVAEKNVAVQNGESVKTDSTMPVARNVNESNPQPIKENPEMADKSVEAAAKNAEGVNLKQPTTVEMAKPPQTDTVNMSNFKEGIENMAKVMSEKMTQGRTEFEIWLEPANLGKMAIKVAYEAGKAMISILCTNQKAMELVSQNAKTLGAIVQQNTGNETVVIIDKPESDYLQNDNDRQQGGNERETNRENSKENDAKEAENQSFLEQMRLGLM